MIKYPLMPRFWTTQLARRNETRRNALRVATHHTLHRTAHRDAPRIATHDATQRTTRRNAPRVAMHHASQRTTRSAHEASQGETRRDSSNRTRRNTPRVTPHMSQRTTRRNAPRNSTNHVSHHTRRILFNFSESGAKIAVPIKYQKMRNSFI